MANLVFFFEAMTISSELKGTFESDIRELFGIRRNNPSFDNYGFMFKILLRSIFHSNLGLSQNDFRFKLLHELQEIIYYKLRGPL
jgi:hypothetical protein